MNPGQVALAWQLGARHRGMLWRTQRPAKRPGYIEPCIPTRASKPPVGPQWIHEIKHYRLIARKREGRVRLFTRNGFDWTERYYMQHDRDMEDAFCSISFPQMGDRLRGLGRCEYVPVDHSRGSRQVAASASSRVRRISPMR
jgi:hypothetical protein